MEHMEDDFSTNLITITDEEGREITLEHLDTYEIGDETYMAFLPENADDLDSYELIILKIEHDDEADEDIFVSLDDEEEEKIFPIFAERLENMFEDEEEDEE